MTDETSPGWASDRRRLAVAFTLALLVPPVAILLHELGHFAVHAAFDYEINRLTFASVVSGRPPAGVDPEFAQNLSFAAGASVSLLIVGLAWASVATIGAHPLALAMVMAESLRAVGTLARHVVEFGPEHALTAGFGEIRYANRALGGPGPIDLLLSWLEVGLPLLALVLVWRQFRGAGRARLSTTVFGGVVAGVGLWIFVVGPALLPA